MFITISISEITNGVLVQTGPVKTQYFPTFDAAASALPTIALEARTRYSGRGPVEANYTSQEVEDDGDTTIHPDFNRGQPVVGTEPDHEDEDESHE